MATELEKRMYPFEKREKMRSHPTYKEIEIPWENGLYLTTQKVGSVNYLIKEAHKKAIIKGFDMLSASAFIARSHSFLKNCFVTPISIKSHGNNSSADRSLSL